jgi:hypothetical protein
MEHEFNHLSHEHVSIELLNILRMERATQTIKFNNKVDDDLQRNKQMIFVIPLNTRRRYVLPKNIPKYCNFVHIL